MENGMKNHKKITKYVRFSLQGSEPHYGILDGRTIKELSGNDPLSFAETGNRIPLAEAEVLLPCTPSKIIGLGLNYVDTVLRNGDRMPNHPKLFIKPPSAVQFYDKPIVIEPMVKDPACEAELGVVIGKTAHRVSRETAMSYIWGYIVGNDVTAQDLQQIDTLWMRAKSFDTFYPVSQYIVRGIDPEDVNIRMTVNGRLAQIGNTKNMLFPIDYLISYISHIVTLYPGDIISTGTPGGYGIPVKAGDIVGVSIDKVGFIHNPVISAEAPYWVNMAKRNEVI